MDKKRRNLEFIGLSVLVVMFFLWYGWPLIWSASANARLVDAFDVDEALHLLIVKEAVGQQSFRIMFNNYGHLYFNLALIPLFVMKLFTTITEQHIIVVLRFIPLLFGMGTVIMSFFFIRRFFGRFAAWLTVLFLSVASLVFLEFSITSHPDIPQVFFLVLGIFFCCRLAEEKHWKWLVWGSVSAGLAFACKYSGIFLLPVLWLVVFVQTINVREDTHPPKSRGIPFDKIASYTIIALGILGIVIGLIITPDFTARYLTGDGHIDGSKLQILELLRMGAIIIGTFLLFFGVARFIIERMGSRTEFFLRGNVLVLKIVVSSVVFGTAFFIASPYLLLGLNFISGILFESQHTAAGHTFLESPDAVLWIRHLVSSKLLGNLIAGLVLISLVTTFYRIIRQGWKRMWTPILVIWIWIVFYTGFLMLRVGLVRDHYLLPVVPLFIILAMLTLKQGTEFAISFVNRRFGMFLAVFIVTAAMGLEVYPSLRDLVEFRRDRMRREQTSSTVAAGLWLEDHYPPSTRILYDRYSYVPPSFRDVQGTFRATGETLESFNPDVVITNEHGMWPFVYESQAPLYVLGEDMFNKRVAYYNNLKNGNAGYELVRGWPDIQIYAKPSYIPE